LYASAGTSSNRSPRGSTSSGCESLIPPDLRNYQGDVIVLFARTEFLNVIHNRANHPLRGQVTVSPQRFGQSLLAVLFFLIVE
jgi:hypothetical protein